MYIPLYPMASKLETTWALKLILRMERKMCGLINLLDLGGSWETIAHGLSEVLWEHSHGRLWMCSLWLLLFFHNRAEEL